MSIDDNINLQIGKIRNTLPENLLEFKDIYLVFFGM